MCDGGLGAVEGRGICDTAGASASAGQSQDGARTSISSTPSSSLAPWKSSIGSFSFVSCQEIFKLVRSIDMISTDFVRSIRYD